MLLDNRPQSRLLRVWHWVSGLVLALLIFSALLIQTFFSPLSMRDFILEKAVGIGFSLDKSQALFLAKEIRDLFFQWHFRLGVVLAVCFVVRMLTRSSNFSSWIPRFPSSRLRAPLSADWHEYFVLWSYRIFYAAVLVTILSGLIMQYPEALRVPEGLDEMAHETHEFLLWFYLAFIGAHVLGVFHQEKQRPGWLSKIIP